MPEQKPDAQAALQKLGQRLREGHAIKHPVPQKSLDTVRTAVREQYEQEQKTTPVKTPEPEQEEEKKRQRDEPSQDR